MQTYIHPGYVRICHWVNAFAILLMVASGWKIYNASPIYHFLFPKSVTIGGWLGGALLWHFAAMWILVANALLYLAMNLLTGRLRSKFFPIAPIAFLRDLKDALLLKLKHSDFSHYNTVQKAAYLSVMLGILITIISGLGVWKSTQFSAIAELIGGYDVARIVHFYGMAFIVSFVLIHLLMVALVPKTMLNMLFASKKIPLLNSGIN